MTDTRTQQEAEIARLRAENEALRKRRNAIDDEAFDCAEQIEDLRAERDEMAMAFRAYLDTVAEAREQCISARPSTSFRSGLTIWDVK